MHDKKIVYTSLNNSILSVLWGLEEGNVPIDSIPNAEQTTLVPVFLTSKMWATVAQQQKSGVPLYTDEEVDVLLADIEQVIL